MLLPFDQPELDAVHDKYKGTGKLYKAPNGKKSNLSHKDWLLVRTTAFKAWFGDWENDPRGRDVSKAIDENGEPLPLYHNLDGSGYSSFTTEKHAGAVPTFLKVLNPYTIYTENPFGDSVEIFTPKARVSVSIEKLVKGVKNGSIGVFRNFDGVMLSNADKGEFCVIMFSKFKPAKTKTYAQSSTEKKLEKSIDADIDARYFVAIDTGDTDTARSIIDEQAHRRGYSSDNSHRIAHQPPRASDNYGTNMAEAITSGLVPDDYWTHPERYTSSPEEQEAFYYVRSAIREHEKRIKEGKTGGVITVYRAVPKDVKETKLRNAYSRKLKAKLVDTFGTEWRQHIPQGYKVFNTLKGSFIHSARSLTEDLLGVALETAGQQLGLSQDTMKILRSKVSDNSDAHLLLLPEALANTLDKLSVPVGIAYELCLSLIHDLTSPVTDSIVYSMHTRY